MPAAGGTIFFCDAFIVAHMNRTINFDDPLSNLDALLQQFALRLFPKTSADGGG